MFVSFRVPYRTLFLTYHPWSSFFLFITSKVKYHFLIVWLDICPLLFMFVSSSDKYRAINVRHIVYNHRRLYLCHPELNTVSLMFDISTMHAHSCVPLHLPPFYAVPYCSTYHPWSSFFMFMFSRVKCHVLIVRHIIYHHNHCLCMCLPELHSVSLLFDVSSMNFIFYVYVFQSSIACPYCSTYHLWSSLFMFVSSRGKYNF